jgi:hypothetical protein
MRQPNCWARAPNPRPYHMAYLEDATGGEEDVRRLDVSVRDVVGV